jgi:hypothetical protein
MSCRLPWIYKYKHYTLNTCFIIVSLILVLDDYLLITIFVIQMAYVFYTLNFVEYARFWNTYFLDFGYVLFDAGYPPLTIGVLLLSYVVFALLYNKYRPR